MSMELTPSTMEWWSWWPASSGPPPSRRRASSPRADASGRACATRSPLATRAALRDRQAPGEWPGRGGWRTQSSDPPPSSGGAARGREGCERRKRKRGRVPSAPRAGPRVAAASGSRPGKRIEDERPADVHRGTLVRLLELKEGRVERGHLLLGRLHEEDATPPGEARRPCEVRTGPRGFTLTRSMEQLRGPTPF